MKIYVTIKKTDDYLEDILFEVSAISFDYDKLVSKFPESNIYLLNIEDDVIELQSKVRSFWYDRIYTGTIIEDAVSDIATGDIHLKRVGEKNTDLIEGYLLHYYEKGTLINSRFEEF